MLGCFFAGLGDISIAKGQFWLKINWTFVFGLNNIAIPHFIYLIYTDIFFLLTLGGYAKKKKARFHSLLL